jgi:hypothetical protein
VSFFIFVRLVTVRFGLWRSPADDTAKLKRRSESLARSYPKRPVDDDEELETLFGLLRKAEPD